MSAALASSGAARVILGTAQFGLAYGISREGGQVEPDEVARILDLAARSGVRRLDTAAAYGESEAVLGAQGAAAAPFAVTTKTLPLRKAAVSAEDIAAVDAALRRSFERLGRARLDAVLVHDARDLLAPGGEGLWRLLEGHKAAGRIGKIGLSAYDGAEIRAAAARFALEVVQLPLSALDQRPIADGTLDFLAERGIEAQARSLLLQGLLLMTAEQVAARLPPAAPATARWRAACAAAGVSPLAAALGFAAARRDIQGLVVGVHSAAHLAECLNALGETADMPWREIASADPAVVDPRRWPAM